MLKNEKKLKSEMEPEKLKENESEHLEDTLKEQVKFILASLQEKANIRAHDLFKQHNGEKAVQTKKSLEKLIHSINSEPNTRTQLRMLVVYKQRKNW